MVYKIQLVNDDHEKSINPYFAECKMPNNVEYMVTRIEYGDYAVMYRGKILFIIERKTWSDLSQSISDGRKDNVNKMIKLREDTGCKLFYLIEGNPCPPKSSKFGRKPVGNLQSHLDHLVFRDNINIIYSRKKETTCERILQLIKNFTTLKPNPLSIIDEELENQESENSDDSQNNPGELEKHESENQNSERNQNENDDAIKRLKVIVRKSDETIIHNIWRCIPNITEKSACLFTCDYHISDLILGNITKKSIEDKKYASGALIGKKRANVIWKCSRDKKENHIHFVNMLIQINGVTKKTAEIIMEKISWKDLLEGKIEVKTLADVKKSESGRKIGNKVAVDIIKYFARPDIHT